MYQIDAQSGGSYIIYDFLGLLSEIKLREEDKQENCG